MIHGRVCPAGVAVYLHVRKTTESAARGVCDCCWEGECSQVYGQMQPFSSFLPRLDLQTATGRGQSDGLRQESLSEAQEGLSFSLQHYQPDTFFRRISRKKREWRELWCSLPGDKVECLSLQGNVRCGAINSHLTFACWTGDRKGPRRRWL